MRFKLPWVTKALREKVSREEECQSPDLRHLPPTPETDEEVTQSLAKLYAKNVRKPRSSSLTYEETRIVVALPQDPGKLEGLKEALGAGGWRLHSIEEWAREIRKAEALGRKEATAGTDLEDIQPLVLEEAPVEGVSDLTTSPCPPSSPASPTDPGEGSAGLLSTVTAAGEGESSPPPLFIMSKFEGNGLQTIVLHAGGSWEINISPCKVQ